MTNPYDSHTGQWLTPFAWAPLAATATNGGSAPTNDVSGTVFDSFGQNGANGGKGATDQGYNGKVDKFSDLLNAGAWGLGSVFGGMLGPATAITNLVVGQNTGKAPSTLNTVRSLLQTLGVLNPAAPPPTALPAISAPSGDSSLSGAQIEVNPMNAGGFGLGALAGTTADPSTINGAVNITGGAVNSMSGAENAGTGGPMEGAGTGGGADAGGGIGGWAQGGYTGNIPRAAVAGPVHGQEFVFSAPATAAIGPDVLAALNAALTNGAPFGWGAQSPSEIRPGEDWTAMIDRIRPKQGNVDPQMVIKPRDPRDSAADTPLFVLPTDPWGRNQMPDRGIWL